MAATASRQVVFGESGHATGVAIRTGDGMIWYNQHISTESKSDLPVNSFIRMYAQVSGPSVLACKVWRAVPGVVSCGPGCAEYLSPQELVRTGCLPCVTTMLVMRRVRSSKYMIRVDSR